MSSAYLSLFHLLNVDQNTILPHLICWLGRPAFKIYNNGNSIGKLWYGPDVLIILMCVCAQSLSHVQLCDTMDCGPPGSSVHGILQARTLEWVAIPFSRGSSQPRDQTHFSCIAGRIFTTARPEKPLSFHQQGLKTLLKDRHQKMNLSIKENFILHKDPGKLHKGSVI